MRVCRREERWTISHASNVTFFRQLHKIRNKRFRVQGNKKSHVYDAPEGNRLAAPFFLPAGRKLPVHEPCANNRCHLAGIPETGGTGWVYSSAGFRTVP